LFEQAKLALSGAHAFYQLKTFFDSFTGTNATRLIELVSPRPKTLDAESENGKAVNEGGSTPPLTSPAVVTTPMSHCRATAYSKPAIENEQDVDAYLAALRADLMKEINSGHIVMKQG
ncbi:MAG: hypothetical protein RR380_04260, partial [Gordonibacter sp.]